MDENTSEPVKYAWFDFFDAEDEFAPIVFPQLDGIDFENGFDGTYTLRVPGGDYKLSIGAHGYDNVMRVLDEAGQATWQSASWEDGASFTLTDDNSTDLGVVQLEGFELSEAELYGFEWVDDDTEMEGSTITGSVNTSEGIAVPKARIVARTKDYLFWLDHVQSRSDGSFELTNMPEGNGYFLLSHLLTRIVFKVFVSPKRSKFHYQMAMDLANLTLQGSNVFGRVLFPQKNRTSGETENNGLAHAFVWAFSDEDQDGEPDWDAEIIAGTEQLTEAFGETDENGYFSFYLEKAGKYSLRIDLPGQLASLAPAPIGFTLKNPKEGVKLGNAVKIDWKAEVRATSFDIERKASTGSSYISLFAGEDNSSSTKPGSNAKSFIDSKIMLGETYSFRVVAETSSGKVTIDSEKVKISDPFIYLAPPSKAIAGRVLDGSNSPVPNAEVVAWREEGEGWSSTFTEEDGSYELTAGPGKWEITVYRPFNEKVDWVYEAAPKRVKFSDDSKANGDKELYRF